MDLLAVKGKDAACSQWERLRKMGIKSLPKMSSDIQGLTLVGSLEGMGWRCSRTQENGEQAGKRP